MMKKILTVVCLAVFILTISTNVFAAMAIGIDLLPGGFDTVGTGKVSESFHLSDSTHQTGNMEAKFLSLEGFAKNIKFGIDYGTGTDEFQSGMFVPSNIKYDYSMLEYKIGPRVLDRERVKLDVVFSNIQLDLTNGGQKISQNAVMVGCDINWLISNKLSLDGYLGHSLITANYEENGINYDRVFLLALKTRLNYLVSDHVSFSLGFRQVCSYIDDYPTASDDGLWRGIGGFTLGMRYSF